jgi:hypothetical protein
MLAFASCQDPQQSIDSIIEITPSNLKFEISQSKNPLWIANTGQQVVTWRILKKPNWALLTADSGKILPKEFDMISVDVLRNNLDNGTYLDSILLAAENIINPIYLEVKVKGPYLYVSSNSIQFHANKDTTQIFLRNNGNSSLHYNIVNPIEWINVRPHKGSIKESQITLTITLDYEKKPQDELCCLEEHFEIRSNINSALIKVSIPCSGI